MSGIPSWAIPGTRVVCIDDAWNGGEYLRLLGYEPPSRVPMLQEVLTIAEVHEWPGGVALYFEEVPPFGWNVNSFRPVVEDKSDNEIEARLYQKRLKSQVISPKPVLVE